MNPLNIDLDDHDELITILIVDDSPIERDIVHDVLSSLYPFVAKIYAPIHLFNEGVEDVITKGQYTYILLDSSLSKHWGSDPKFGEWGENMIPFIKEKSKASIIVAIASNEEDNQMMVAKGAKFAINKRRFQDEKFKNELQMPYPA